VTAPQSPRKPEPVAYKGEALDAARGPGLGCFWTQMIVLLGLIILTPVTVSLGAPPLVSGILLFLVILLLLLTGQTMIFLLRLVAAGRSDGRRRPLASTTPTVGEIEDEAQTGTASSGSGAAAPDASAHASPDASPAAVSPTSALATEADGTGGNDGSGVRQ
jgi:hypothetical protein